MIAQLDKDMIRARPGAVWSRLVAYFLFEGRPLTTKGQWINPGVFGGYRLAGHLPGKGVDDPVFIIGTGRSGTTVLGKLFALHGDAMFLNEPKALWHHAHGEEDIIGSYAKKTGRVRLAPSEATEEMRTAIGRVYQWALRTALRKRVVDKYPELVFRVPFVKALFPKAKFVAIVRDGVDTVASVEFWSERKGETVGDERHDWWGRNDRKWHALVNDIVPEHPDLAPMQPQLAKLENHLDRAAVEWIISMREAKNVAEAYPDAVHVMKYEELCSDHDRQLRLMLEHCDLPVDDAMLSYASEILVPAKPKTLKLAEFLVPSFVATLEAMGYGSSASRVSSRAD